MRRRYLRQAAILERPGAADPFTAQVKEMIKLAGEYGERDAYGGKRGQLRVAEGLPLELSLDGVSAMSVSMQDVSQTGISFWSRQKLDPRSDARIRMFCAEGKRDWLTIKIKHCTTGIRGYLIGAEFIH